MTNTLGQALQQRREQLGISRERAAVALNTTANTYAGWESGKNPPRKLSWVDPLARFLGDGYGRADVALMILVDLDRLMERRPGLLNRVTYALSSPAPVAVYA